ncbi:hypothetical protein D3C71_1674430 [compost metagenome]
MRGQRAHDQPGVLLGPAYAQRDVDALRGQVDMGIGQHQVQRHARMRPQKARDVRPHAQPPEGHRHRHAQRPHGLGARVRHAAIGLIEIGQQPRNLLQVGRARIGQHHLARGAREQRHAQRCLEAVDQPRDRRGGDTAALGGLGEATGLRHIHESAQRLELVHGSPLRNLQLLIAITAYSFN